MKNNLITKDGRPACTKFKQCGGCSYDMPYEQQCERKLGSLKRRLSRFGRVSDIVTMDKPYRCRCKLTRVYKRAANGQLVSCIFKSKSLSCVPVYDCMLEDKRLCVIARELGEVFTRFKITPYDYRTGRGTLRQIMLRKGLKTGQILLCIVTAPHSLKSPKALGETIAKRFPDITTVVHNECKNPLPLTLGDKETVLTGRGYIEDELLGLRFRISAGSFMQVNPSQTERLYSIARDMLGEGVETLLDAYCGTGTVGLVCAGKARRLIGVEKTPSAVRDAVQNAKNNAAVNAEFICADASDYMRSLAERGEDIDAVIMDPPRAGADKRFIDALSALAPKRIVYISCSSETLSRDLYLLKKCGYKALKIQPVDMFPHTKHIETVTLLQAAKE